MFNFAFADGLFGPLNLFVTQTVNIGLQLLLAYIIWLIGKWIIGMAIRGIELIDVKKWDIDDHIRGTIKKVFVPTAHVVLVLIILDTLNIGSSVVAAIAGGLTFTVAIALGLAFGRAFEDDARRIVDNVRKDVVRK